MKIAFRDARLSAASKARLALINGIIEEYQSQGYRLTLRQLYYQLVSRVVIPNKGKEYDKLSVLLREGRMCGIVDWDAIEDRLRRPSSPASFNSPQEILDAAIAQYQLPRQEGQDTYLEVWVEKDALSGVLGRVTRKYHVPILVNRGYSSASAMFDSYQRFENAYNNDQSIKIIYLGDYDPSGIDMIRDVEGRTREFIEGQHGDGYAFDFEILPVALTRAQIKQYNPPPNPAKMTDSRAAGFVREHGTQSWEVDALRPEVLNGILEAAILAHIDEKRYKAVVGREEADKKKLRALKAHL
jgi:hypothetical protein